MLSRRTTATRCCRHRSAHGSRSKRACRRAGIATSATAATCSAWIVSARRRQATVVMREYGFTVENVCKRTLALLR